MNSTTDSGSGTRLRALRLDRGLTVEEAAEAAGVGSASLKRLERGSTKPRPSTAATLAAFYGVRASDIWMPGVLTTPGSRPMQITLNDPTMHGAALPLGHIQYRENGYGGSRLTIAMRQSTWRLLIPRADYARVQDVDRARGARADAVTDDDRLRARAITTLTQNTWGTEDVRTVTVQPQSEELFAELFDDLLARARQSDQIETAPAETHYDYFREEDVTLPARTAPTAPIVAELEGFAQHVPWLDTAKKAVTA